MWSGKFLAAMTLVCGALLHTRANTGVTSKFFQRIGYSSGSISSFLNVTTRSFVECAAICRKKQPQCRGMLVGLSPGKRTECLLTTSEGLQRVTYVYSEVPSAKAVYVLRATYDKTPTFSARTTTTTTTTTTTKAPTSPCIAGRSWQLIANDNQHIEVSTMCRGICNSKGLLDQFTDTWSKPDSTRCCKAPNGSCQDAEAWPCCDKGQAPCHKQCDCRAKKACMCRTAFRGLLCVSNNATRRYVSERYSL